MTYLKEPPGEPAAIRIAAIRLTKMAAGAIEVGDELEDKSVGVEQLWSGKAQMVFSLLAATVANLVGGSGRIAGEFSSALSRYAQLLEASQHEVRLARSQLGMAKTSPIPDPVAVAATLDRATRATLEAAGAARALSQKALDLMGGSPNGQSVWQEGNTAATSFVSNAHSVSGELVATVPQGSFDVAAARVEAQLGSVMSALVPGHKKSIAVLPAGSSPSSVTPSALILGPQASSVEGSIMIKPGSGTGAGTVLLGAQGPLTTAPGLAVLAPGIGPPPSHVAVLPAQFDATTAYLLSGPSPEVQAKIAEYQDYLNSPAYTANLERSRGAGYESVNIGLIGNALRNSQDWTTKYQQAWHETFQGVDYNDDGYIGI